MQLTFIIYESKYGSTEDAVKKMALMLAPSRYCRPAEFKSEFSKDCDFFVIGGPVYSENIDQRIFDFVSANNSWLSNKRVALFCTCLDTSDRAMGYLEPLMKILGNSVVSTQAIGGKIQLEKLDQADLNAMESFSQRSSGRPPRDVDRSDLEKLVDYSLRIKSIKDMGYKPMPTEQLKTHLEEFLKSRNTCTLCTSFGTRVRGTTINYTYHEGHIYAICEGSEKFGNVLLNNNVSVALYGEKFTGLQLSGTATILYHGSDELKEMIETTGRDYSQLMALPFFLNGLSIKLHKAEFFCPEFGKLGYGSKQTYLF